MGFWHSVVFDWVLEVNVLVGHRAWFCVVVVVVGDRKLSQITLQTFRETKWTGTSSSSKEPRGGRAILNELV